MNSYKWAELFTQIWHGSTIKQACGYLALDYATVQNEMTIEIRSFIVDVSMVAGAKSELLNELKKGETDGGN